MDNKGVINRLSKSIPKSFSNPNDTFLPEWDVRTEIKHTLTQMGATITILHVKAHQDDSTEVSQLFLAAKLNITCDALATLFLRNKAMIYKHSPQFPSTKCHLYIDNMVVTSQLKPKVRTANSLPAFRAYIESKLGWFNNEWELINWPAHATALNNNYHRKKRIIKLIHNQLPTGAIMKRRLPTYDDLCKACNSSVETNLHLLCCPHSDYHLWRISVSQGIASLCNALDTDPVLTDILLLGLKASAQRIHQHTRSLSTKYQELSDDQEAIGWGNF